MSTSYVQDRDAPSAGTKVSGGQNAPVVREGAGNVASESLAAESYREGGGFASNAGAEPGSYSTHKASSRDTELSSAPDAESRKNAYDSTTTNSERYDAATGRSADNLGDSYGGTAPSYIAGQYQQDPNGPHGKNLSEGDWDESKGRDGLRKALASEPGSSNDPSRLAEQDFKLQDAAVGGNGGPRQSERDGDNTYSNLDSNVSA